MSDVQSIIVTSLGNIDIFPHNNASAFTNKLQDTVILEANSQYEIALLDIFFSKQYYCLLEGDEESSITIFLKKYDDGGYNIVDAETPIWTFIPKQNILAGEVAYVIDNINSDLKQKLQNTEFAKLYKQYLNEHGLFYYDTLSKRVSIIWTLGPMCTPESPVCELTLKIGERMAGVLGFESGKQYQLFGPRGDGFLIKESFNLISPYPANYTSNIDYIIVYSDIVDRTPLAGQNVNVLDIIDLDNTKGFHNTVYYPLNTKTINTVSIRLLDQLGREIKFKAGSNTICVLQLRKKRYML